ncbi:MAG TPA: hypothetical protein DEH78_15350 [Solibacterales bacterium]|nr:hypothetical protein [Bryobacterales bacterium]
MKGKNLFLLCAFFPLCAAHGSMIYINSDLVSGYTAVSTVVGAKYRLSPTGFDETLGLTASGGNPASRININLGNLTFLSGRTYDLELQHLTGQGFIFRMTNGAATNTLSWGTFTTTPPGTNAAQLRGTAPGAAFNALVFNARAIRNPSSMAFSGLTFTSPTLTTSTGAFLAGSVATPGTTTSTQLLVSPLNLATHNWTVRGRVTGVRGGNGGDDDVWFTIEGQNANFTIATPAPEPPSWYLMAGGGLIGLFGLIRQYSRRGAVENGRETRPRREALAAGRI